MSGLPAAYAIAFAYVISTRRDPARPGPWVTATASTSSRVMPAWFSASRTTGTIARRCSREASSGTTPPYLPCVSSCDATIDESTRSPSSTTAEAVSSQELSIPRILTSLVILTVVLVSDFDYSLPEELIAQEPLPDRADSRMLVVHRADQTWDDGQFREIAAYIQPG